MNSKDVLIWEQFNNHFTNEIHMTISIRNVEFKKLPVIQSRVSSVWTEFHYFETKLQKFRRL